MNFSLLPEARAYLLGNGSAILIHPMHDPIIVDLRTGEVTAVLKGALEKAQRELIDNAILAVRQVT